MDKITQFFNQEIKIDGLTFTVGMVVVVVVVGYLIWFKK